MQMERPLLITIWQMQSPVLLTQLSFTALGYLDFADKQGKGGEHLPLPSVLNQSLKGFSGNLQNQVVSGFAYLLSTLAIFPQHLSGSPDLSLTSVSTPAFFQNKPTSKPASFLFLNDPNAVSRRLAQLWCLTLNQGDTRLAAITQVPGSL